VLKYVPDCRERAVDAMGLGDCALIDGHVEIDANKHCLAAKLQIAEFSNHGDRLRFLGAKYLFSID
jgi:hypothetical protein